jgi:hypothetical protein
MIEAMVVIILTVAILFVKAAFLDYLDSVRK